MASRGSDLSAPNNHDIFIFTFLHIFRSPAFDFNVGVAMNESYCFTLTSAMFKVDVVSYVTMTTCVVIRFYSSHGSDKGM